MGMGIQARKHKHKCGAPLVSGLLSDDDYKSDTDATATTADLTTIADADDANYQDDIVNDDKGYKPPEEQQSREPPDKLMYNGDGESMNTKNKRGCQQAGNHADYHETREVCQHTSRRGCSS